MTKADVAYAHDPSVAEVEAEPHALEIKDLKYQYPSGTLALEEISFTVPQNSVLGIVGPSGCGKSTLLQIVAGLKSQTAGEVSRGPAQPGRHPLSMVFQQDTVLPWMTVERNVGVHWRFGKPDLTKRERAQRLDRLLEMAGLLHVRKKYPYELSGGMRRRVAFLAAMAPYPSMLLLDEPFSSLDVPTRVGIHQSVHDIVREVGTSTILVTHDLEEAISLSDEIVILSSGPGRIAARHQVPFGKERNILELRGTSEFLDLYGLLWKDLSKQIIESGKGMP